MGAPRVRSIISARMVKTKSNMKEKEREGIGKIEMSYMLKRGLANIHSYLILITL